MVIDTGSIKIYPCVVWSEGLTHGGDIDIAVAITNASSNNIYDDVTNSERLNGITDTSSNAYRKIFVRNENIDTWANIKCYISQATLATNDEIHISEASGNDTTAEADDYSYVTPISYAHADAIVLGSLIQNGSAAIWIQRLVDPSGNGYKNNTFILAFEDASGNTKTITAKYDIFTPAVSNIFDLFDYPYELVRKNVTPGYTDTNGDWVAATSTETQIYGHLSDLTLEELKYIDPIIVESGVRKLSVSQDYGFKTEDKITVTELDGSETEWEIYLKQSASSLMKKYFILNRETYILRKIT